MGRQIDGFGFKKRIYKLNGWNSEKLVRFLRWIWKMYFVCFGGKGFLWNFFFFV